MILANSSEFRGDMRTPAKHPPIDDSVLPTTFCCVSIFMPLIGDTCRNGGLMCSAHGGCRM